MLPTSAGWANDLVLCFNNSNSTNSGSNPGHGNNTAVMNHQHHHNSHLQSPHPYTEMNVEPVYIYNDDVPFYLHNAYSAPCLSYQQQQHHHQTSHHPTISTSPSDMFARAYPISNHMIPCSEMLRNSPESALSDGNNPLNGFQQRSVVPLSSSSGSSIITNHQSSTNTIKIEDTSINATNNVNSVANANNGKQREGGIIYGYPEINPKNPGIHIPRAKPTILSKDPTLAKRCSICNQPFERDNSLRRHELLHSGLKPYKCMPCNKDFTRQDIYRRHQQSSRCRKATERNQRCLMAENTHSRD